MFVLSGMVAFVGSHLDVVPANPETWERNPFKLVVEVGTQLLFKWLVWSRLKFTSSPLLSSPLLSSPLLSSPLLSSPLLSSPLLSSPLLSPLPLLQGDKLYGRGTTDSLGHVALITELFIQLALKKPKLKYSVVAVFIAA